MPVLIPYSNLMKNLTTTVLTFEYDLMLIMDSGLLFWSG